jgi:predicted LPLAT superfamily acyltransferase
MADPLRFCAIVPLFDNASTVAAVVRGCLEHVGEVIVVDDGSTDDGPARVRDVEGATLVSLGRNRGKGAALRRGLEEAARRRYTHAIAIDADGQHDPSYIPRFRETAARRPGAIITGVRRLERAGAPGSSHFGRFFSNFWYAVETWRTVADSQCGYRAYPVERTLALRTRTNRYTIEHETIVLAAWSGMEVHGEVVMDVHYGEDVVSHFRSLDDNVRHSFLNAFFTLARYSGAHRLLRRELPPPPGSGRPDWIDARSLGNRPGYWWFETLARLGGVDAAYRFLDVVVSYYAAFAPREYREASLSYLRRQFPGAGRWELERHRWRHFRSFGETVLDQGLVPHVDLSTIRIQGHGLEHIEGAARAGGGLILLGAHFGPWQYAAMGLGRRGITVHVAALIQEARAMDAYLSAQRSRTTDPMPEIILLSGDSPFSSLPVVEALREGKVVALHADRTILGKSARVPFLGDDASFPLGPFVLAEVTGAPVCIWFAAKTDRRTVRVQVHEPITVGPGPRSGRDRRIRDALYRYVELLEQTVRNHPYQWYNFYDFWA